MTKKRLPQTKLNLSYCTKPTKLSKQIDKPMEAYQLNKDKISGLLVEASLEFGKTQHPKKLAIYD